jgi:hypothetical protein
VSKKIMAVLVAILALSILGLAGCDYSQYYPEYQFQGKIDGKAIHSEMANDGYITITVAQPDASKLVYRGKPGTKELTSLKIVPANGEESLYDYTDLEKRPTIKKMMEEASLRFKDYLEKIAEIKTSHFYK